VEPGLKLAQLGRNTAELATPTSANPPQQRRRRVWQVRRAARLAGRQAGSRRRCHRIPDEVITSFLVPGMRRVRAATRCRGTGRREERERSRITTE